MHDSGHTADTTDLRAELAQLRADLDEVRAENAALTARLDEAGGEPPVASLGEHRRTRRGMLRLAGAAAVGAAAAASGGVRPVAALDGEAMRVGFFHPQTRTTTLSYGVAAASQGALVTDSSTAMLRVETNHLDSTAINAVGSYYGIVGDGAETGFIGFNGRYNFVAGASEKAALRLIPVNSIGAVAKTAPPSRVDFHFPGEIDTDANGDLWFSVEGGTPGRWRKLAGATTAGAFHAINPVRVYDSRAAAPTPGALTGGSDRIVSVRDARPDATGAVATVGVVPAGASAVAYNITVADTTGAGFLSVNPGDATGFSASSINWSASGQLLANGLVVKLDASRNVRVFAGGAGSTNFIIDVLGYYL